MLYLIQNHHRPYFKDMLDDMHQKRYDVFYKKLGWQIPVQDGREIDQYDIPEALYLIYHSKKAGVRGGVRLMPTTGPNMLRDTFSHLVDQPADIPCDSKIWDISRLFFIKAKGKNDTTNYARRGTLKILTAACEFALSWGIKQLVCVTTLKVEALLKDFGSQVLRLGTPKTVHDDPDPVVALSISITEQTLIQFYYKTGLGPSMTKLLLPFSIEHANGFQGIASMQQQQHLTARL